MPGADISDLRALVENEISGRFEAACQEMAARLQAVAPVDSGATREAITVTNVVYGPPIWSATILIDTPQADWTNDGTGPHVIEGNPLLHFEWGGVSITVRSVQHPGSTKHAGWITNTVETEWPQIVDEMFVA